jgi:predicted RNase H-like HicB family nuclease
LKNSYIYPAVFEKTATGYCVHFPDLPGCVSSAKSLEEAHRMAAEGLGLHLWGMETDNDDIPEPTPVDNIEMDGGEVVGIVSVWMPPVRAKLDNKAVKKTLTIPSYLNTLAEQKKINFSRVLQTALKKELGI